MSAETQEWLDRNVLVGFTDKRGTAWHYREGTDNHFTGAIPLAEVESRLFNWEGLSLPVEYTLPNGKHHTALDRQVIVRSDTGDALGVFRDAYKIHQYKPWLIGTTQTITDSDLEIGSAGLLKNGGQAWVQFELPETVQAAEGVEFRPFITGATSMDGSMATSFFTGAQVVVCDNTLSAARTAAKDSTVKVRHSKNSLNRIGEAREALGLVYQAADNFQAEVARLTAEVVTNDEWAAFVEAYTATTAADPMAKNSKATAISERRAGELNSLWNASPMVAPWKGSAFGVLQAVNTHTTHIATVRNADRAERNMTRFLSGGVDRMDQGTIALLAQVTKRPDLVLA